MHATERPPLRTPTHFRYSKFILAVIVASTQSGCWSVRADYDIVQKATGFVCAPGNTISYDGYDFSGVSKICKNKQGNYDGSFFGATNGYLNVKTFYVNGVEKGPAYVYEKDGKLYKTITPDEIEKERHK